jgi:hypothetical protein
LPLSFWAGRGNINHLVEFDAGGVAAAEPTLDLDILNRELPQDPNDVSANNGQRFAAGGRNTEKTLQVNGLR